MEPLWESKEQLAPGIYLYRNLIQENLNIIDRISGVLGEPEGPKKRYNWSPAFVGYQQRMPEYRDCADFKFKKSDLSGDPHPDSLLLQEIWQEVYDRQHPAVTDYCTDHNIMELRYWEAFNFIRYEKGQHFMEHHDHGFSYNCVVSLVTYLNDDFEGGELEFRTWGLTYKPKAGDVVVFPSNFMYPHKACAVQEGTKYSIVTMLDYSDKYHNPKFYQETGT